MVWEFGVVGFLFILFGIVQGCQEQVWSETRETYVHTVLHATVLHAEPPGENCKLTLSGFHQLPLQQQFQDHNSIWYCNQKNSLTLLSMGQTLSPSLFQRFAMACLEEV